MSDEWTLRDEIEAAERRLLAMCHQVQAGQREGGGREFERAIDAQFRAIKAALDAEHAPTKEPKA